MHLYLIFNLYIIPPEAMYHQDVYPLKQSLPLSCYGTVGSCPVGNWSPIGSITVGSGELKYNKTYPVYIPVIMIITIMIIN